MWATPYWAMVVARRGHRRGRHGVVRCHSAFDQNRFDCSGAQLVSPPPHVHVLQGSPSRAKESPSGGAVREHDGILLVIAGAIELHSGGARRGTERRRSIASFWDGADVASALRLHGPSPPTRPIASDPHGGSYQRPCLRRSDVNLTTCRPRCESTYCAHVRSALQSYGRRLPVLLAIALWAA